jgi:hypothetical protein
VPAPPHARPNTRRAPRRPPTSRCPAGCGAVIRRRTSPRRDYTPVATSNPAGGGVQTVERYRGQQPSLVSVDHLAAPAARRPRLDLLATAAAAPAAILPDTGAQFPAQLAEIDAARPADPRARGRGSGVWVEVGEHLARRCSAGVGPSTTRRGLAAPVPSSSSGRPAAERVRVYGRRGVVLREGRPASTAVARSDSMIWRPTSPSLRLWSRE